MIFLDYLFLNNNYIALKQLSEKSDLTDEDIIKQTDKLGIPVSEDTYDIKSLLEDIALERGILDSIVELAEAFKNQDKKNIYFNRYK